MLSTPTPIAVMAQLTRWLSNVRLRMRFAEGIDVSFGTLMLVALARDFEETGGADGANANNRGCGASSLAHARTSAVVWV